MKDNRCFICKYNEENVAKASDDLIYSHGKPIVVPLCYGHSVELFKAGQRLFVAKHKEIFSDKLGFENEVQLVKYFSSGFTERSRSWF